MDPRDLCPDCLAVALTDAPTGFCVTCSSLSAPADRRRSTPHHRDIVHVTALALVRIWGDDHAKALEAATRFTYGEPSDVTRFYMDVCSLLSRRLDTLNAGRAE